MQFSVNLLFNIYNAHNTLLQILVIDCVSFIPAILPSDVQSTLISFCYAFLFIYRFNIFEFIHASPEFSYVDSFLKQT